MTHTNGLFSLVSRPYVNDEGLIWPRYKVLTDFSGANPEKFYDGEAHGEARAAGIHECTSVENWHRMPYPFDCVACAVEEGLAVMIQWDYDRIDTRELSKRRTRAIAKAHEGMWAKPKCEGCQIQDCEIEGNTLTPCTCGRMVGYPEVR